MSREFDPAWLDVVGAHRGRPILFVTEAVLLYFQEAEVKGLFLTLLRRFPGSVLDCDTLTPLGAWIYNSSLAVCGKEARVQWTPAHGREPERWDAGIRLLEDLWYDRGLRLGEGLLRLIPSPKVGSIYRYQLGDKTAPG